MNQNKIEFDKGGQIDSKFPKIKFSLGENLVDCTLSGCWSVGSYSIDAIRTQWNHFRKSILRSRDMNLGSMMKLFGILHWLLFCITAEKT